MFEYLSKIHGTFRYFSNSVRGFISYVFNSIGYNNGLRTIKNNGKYGNAIAYSGQGIKTNGTNQIARVPISYSNGDTDICTYKDYVSFDGTQDDYSSAYSQYMDTKPYACYVIKVDIKSANDLSKGGIRFGMNEWYRFSRYGITTTGIHYFATKSGPDTREYVRWFAMNGFEGEFGNVEVYEIIQDDLAAYYFDLNDGSLVKDVLTRKIISYDIGRDNNQVAGYMRSHFMNNLIIHKGLLPPDKEKALQTSPETFLYKEAGVLKSKVLTQSEIGNVVAYLPLCETSGENIVDILSGSPTPIVNFTNSVRDDAKQLQYGL